MCTRMFGEQIMGAFELTNVKEEAIGRSYPNGHLKLLHLWPGQTPPPEATRQGWNLIGLAALGNARCGLL